MHVARLQRRHERRVRAQGSRDDHHAGSVLVEPMHNAGARNLGEFRIMMQQRVLQRASRLAGARMHGQAGGLVDHEQVGVFEADVQRD